MAGKINSIFLIFLFLLIGKNSVSQNLVPNPSFEEFISCPAINLDSTIKFLTHWRPLTTQSIFLNSPDYYNACVPLNNTNSSVPLNNIGNQLPRTGNGYIGLFGFSRGPIPFFEDSLPIGREYVEVKLRNPLVSGQKYYVEFHASLADNVEYAISSLGAFFSDTPLIAIRNYVGKKCQVQNMKLNVLTDKENWIMIADSFEAKGGEQYLYLGNFVHDSLSDTTKLNSGFFSGSAYYYIDDVLVVDVDSLEFLTTDIKAPKEEGLTSRVKVFPNPFNSNLQIKIENAQLNDAELILTDLLGRTVAKEKLRTELTNFSTQDWAKGMYVWSLVEDGLVVKSGKVVKE